MPAPLLSSFAPSLSGGFALFGRRDSDVVIPTYTNAQKLSLPTNTAVGTRVKVSDGFVVSGAGSSAANKFWFRDGVWNGRNAYLFAGGSSIVADGDAVRWSGTQWEMGTSATDVLYFSTDDVLEPWLVTTWQTANGVNPLPVLTHPVVQQLAAPSSAQGGVFVSGGTQDGIYVSSGIDSNFGRTNFGLLGQSTVSSATDPYAFGWNGDEAKWQILDAGQFVLYYSLSDVATPDLATDWKNASDDSPASITVTSVTGGQVAAGMKFGSDFYAVTTPVNGRNAYHDVLGVAPDFTFNGSIWTDGTHNGTGAPAFPWNVTGITITQDNVASETNWTNV
jgi:hypothetical protein